ncbi:FAD-binding oxidoreductase [Stenotrophomonas sp. B2]|uniref:NAD(P)/FAD-dependent oxidoreductase n=1 Tax=Stenotrophomonas sp. B2 TaxID=1537778 RepID=UPI001876A6A7|nr:FAD-binding oxidoreductase [Stenotrophomonas sp. B2]MBE5268807.1 FAD-binding oxidoreductase [Stenotrophomonas sp. B2]
MTSAFPASWYAASLPEPAALPPLQGDVQADVAVLGAGYTGLTAALELASRGQHVVLLDAHRIGWGASGRNGGQALVGYGCEVDELERQLGRDDARHLFDWSRDAVQAMRTRIDRYGIDCHWREGHASVAIRARHERELRAHCEHLQQQYDYPMQWWDRQTLRGQLDSPRYRAAMFDPLSAHLHPLAYARGLADAARAAGVVIHENSAVTRVQRGPRPALHTAHGSVSAAHLVIAGNAWLQGLLPVLEHRIMPVGTYIGASACLGPERARALIRNDMAVADTAWALDYFRLSHDHRLLFGGRASYSALPPPGLRGVMQRRMHAVFPQLADVALDQVWGGYVDITRNRAPHWGRLDGNLYFAQGFSGHGVAAAGLAGDVIAAAIAGQSERLDVFQRLKHAPFPGGRLLRMPLLVAAMSWYRLRDALW